MSENPTEHVRVDLDMEVDPPVTPGIEPPNVPSHLYVTYVIDEPGAKPGEEGLYDGYEVASVPATGPEILRWQHAHAEYRHSILEARVRLQAVEDQLKAAQAAYLAEVTLAAKRYAPVHQEIENRKALVEAEDDLLRERKAHLQEEVDEALLGPKNWVIFHRQNQRGLRVFGGTLHLVTCGQVTRADWDAIGKPMRRDDARVQLSRKNVKACGRCKAEEALNWAEMNAGA